MKLLTQRSTLAEYPRAIHRSPSTGDSNRPRQHPSNGRYRGQMVRFIGAVILLGALGLAGRAHSNPAAPIEKASASVTPATESSLLDPQTGLPLPHWKDPKWADPGITMREVMYESSPLQDIAQQLRVQFRDTFDIHIPQEWRDANNASFSLQPSMEPLSLQLKNVSASELFNAMNLAFDAENRPFRWELKVNGNRQMAVLRVLPQRIPASHTAPPAPDPPQRRVYFVGDLVRPVEGRGGVQPERVETDPPGSMSIEELAKTVADIYNMSFGTPKVNLRLHKEAQLLIMTGDSEQMAFIDQTLSALRARKQAQASAARSAVIPKPAPQPGHAP